MKIFLSHLDSVIKECEDKIQKARKFLNTNDLSNYKELKYNVSGQIQACIGIKAYCLKRKREIKTFKAKR